MKYTSLLAAALAAALTAGCGGGNAPQAANQPPVIRAASIGPDPAVPNSTVSVNADVYDTENDPVTLTCAWTVNGKPVESGDASQLSTAGLKPGDVIKAVVTANDSLASSQPFTTSEVTLQENRSGIDSVTLDPSPLRTGSASLTATPYLKPGAAASTKIIYRWNVGGKDLAETGPTISLPGLKNGDKVTVEATAEVGGQRSNPYRMTVIAVNDAPVIQSITVASQDMANFKYQVTATDPDNDPISYQLLSGPDGATIDGSGLITVPVDKAGQTIRIKVSDNQGNAIERNLEAGK